ncbi:distal tail protein Dit [Vallitalea guaymasensis]|uniref:distal tail protein Dit n=1 Tax=Vallitalea guaymasensis TaxID=1185412 RepID=UPI000DE3F268|nr:distal tail protein Dit [Vallitalea guaymasensis]
MIFKNFLMEYGFTWNGKDSKDFNIIMSKRDMPILPQRRLIEKEIPGINGTVFYDTGLHKNIVIKVECYLKTKGIEWLQLRKWDIKNWLDTGEGKLSFEDEGDKYYIARITNATVIEQLLNFGRFTLTFSCKPYALSLHKSTDELKYTDPFAYYNKGYKYDMSPSKWTVNTNITKTVYNWGKQKVSPVIKVVGSCVAIAFECNGIKVAYNGALTNETLLIDCRNYTAIKGKDNVLKHLVITPNEWDTMELIEGDNDFSITGTALNVQVEVIYSGKY